MLYDKRDCGCGFEHGIREPMMMQPMMGQPMMGQPMMGQPMMAPAYADGMGGCGCPIVEPAIEKCVKRDFCHEVRHICPVHTTVVNNHIFRHVYDPQFSCSEENVVTNLDPGCGCNMYR